MGKINNATFIKAVAKRTGYAQHNIKEVMESIEEELIAILKTGDSVKALPSITFEIGSTSSRTGFNPITKERITIPASTHPRAKFTASFKDAVK